MAVSQLAVAAWHVWSFVLKDETRTAQRRHLFVSECHEVPVTPLGSPRADAVLQRPDLPRCSGVLCLP